MPKIKIKSIIFDFGGVVAHGGYLNFIRHYCMQCLTPAGKLRIKALEHQVNLGRISETKFYREISKVFSVHITPKKMRQLITEKMTANKSLVKFIPKLKQAKIVLFTNSIGFMARDVYRARRLSNKLFDRVFLSNVIHLAKPDKEAYAYVVRKLKVKPSETLMVDDRLENIIPARELGMNGIVFKNTSQFKKELKKYELV